MNYENDNSTKRRFLLLPNEYSSKNKHLVTWRLINVTPTLGQRTRMHAKSRIPAVTSYEEIIPSFSQFIIANHHFHLHYRRRVNTTQTHRQSPRSTCLQLYQEHIKRISRLINEKLFHTRQSSHPPKSIPCPPPVKHMHTGVQRPL